MSSAKFACLLLGAAIAGCSATPPQRTRHEAPAPVAARHVPSPDWRDQVIYFAMIDRFDDGDPGNNDLGAGEYDPTRNSHYSGGDLKGLERRLDYIRELGATTLWITPPVANQWWNPNRQYTGYHGYWTEHFKEVDRHYGTLADYQSLAEGLHRRGMYLVQDIVVNHTGNWFGYDEEFVAGDAVRGYVRYGEEGAGGTGHGVREERATHEPAGHVVNGSGACDRAPVRDHHPCPVPHAPCPALGQPPAPCPAVAPSQPPFHQNDPRDPAQRAADIYHWTPDIRDYQDPNQEANFQMAGLDDLNTENPEVRRALRDSYGYWIREVGVDGFRVDTAFYVPPDYFEDFVHADDPAAPGIDAVARSTGRDAFLNFGEGFALDAPYAEKSARKIDAYVRGEDGRPRLQGMLNFPLYGSLVDVFARGRPTAELAHRIESMVRVHANPHLMPSFIDNHDIDRFLAGGSEAALKQALLALLTLPGIPVIYYGTEQGFREPRAAMFAAGYGSGGRDHFDTSAPLYQFLQQAIALRRDHPVLSRGVPELLHSNRAGAGALAWRMRDGDEQLIVVMNTADETVLLDHLATGLAPGTQLDELFAIGASVGAGSTRDSRDEPARTAMSADGSFTAVLPARSAFVLQPMDAAADKAPGQGPDPRRCAASGGSGPCPDALPTIALDPTTTTTYGGDFELAGSAIGRTHLQLVVDGRLVDAQSVDVAADGRWFARVDTRAMLDPQLEHRLVAWDVDSGAVSEPMSFRVQRPWQQLANVADPLGDDHGHSGRYQYPTDPAFAQHRPNDIERVTVHGSGGALRVEVTMRNVLATWNPPNGFDHVAFNVYVELPAKPGTEAGPCRAELAPLPSTDVDHGRCSGASSALQRADGSGASSALPEQGKSACLPQGIRAMPLQFGDLPGDMRWHYRVRAHGWSNALFSAAGASATAEGTPVIPTATVATDAARRTVSFTLPSAALGNPATLAGARLYISTWDYDGGFRDLAAEPGPYTYGGGAPDQPRVMDEVLVRLP
jgi:glycosidase